MSSALNIILLFVCFVLFLLFIVFLIGFYNVLKKSQTYLFEFSVDDLALICRSISDSMNYKSQDRYKEKWDLLLKCKRYHLDLEENIQDLNSRKKE